MPPSSNIQLLFGILFLLLIPFISGWMPARIFTRRHRIPITTTTTRLMAQKSDDDREAESSNDHRPAGYNVLRRCNKHVGYNVLGTELFLCGSSIVDDRRGRLYLRSTADDEVCVRVTDDFLRFSEGAGNDLRTPAPRSGFPGLVHGDLWPLCADRWAEAYNAGRAPRLLLRATHEGALDHVPLEVLMVFAIDYEEANAIIERLDSQRAALDEMMSKDVVHSSGKCVSEFQ